VTRIKRLSYVAALLAVPAFGCSQPQAAPSPPVEPAAAPAAPAAPGADITQADLNDRLTAYAHDSMMGREAGTLGNYMATEYIAAEAQRLGLEPAGENGTYFQTIPLVTTSMDPTSSLSSGDSDFTLWTDFAPLPTLFAGFGFRAEGTLENVEVIYGGRLGAETMLAPNQMEGKLVVLDAPLGPDGSPHFQFWQPLTGGGAEGYSSAAALAFVTLDISPPGFMGFLQQPGESLDDQPDKAAESPLSMLISERVAAQLLGASTENAPVGTVGGTASLSTKIAKSPPEAPARNVIAILRGSDPALRAQFVSIGAHNDHVGMTPNPRDHDSLRALNTVVRPQGAESQQRPPTEEEIARIRAILDSLQATRPARLDSVFNGADDDGSGTVSVLEIAEKFALAPDRPRRSILFVWQTAEEKGLYGAEYYTDHPTVPRDSIVANINIDMVGRGRPDDVELGELGYLQIIGSQRLSTELGDLVETVNTRGGWGMKFDYQYDADGHPSQYYCRSDHYMYARYGIPIVFFTTGSHRDYHQLTDEAEYIDYEQLALVSNFVYDVVLTLANLDHRVVVDKPKPDPNAQCRQ
jgi:hypothetical protein